MQATRRGDCMIVKRAKSDRRGLSETASGCDPWLDVLVEFIESCLMNLKENFA